MLSMRIEDLKDALPTTRFRRDPLPYEAGFLAGKAFLRYRRSRQEQDDTTAGLLLRRTRTAAFKGFSDEHVVHPVSARDDEPTYFRAGGRSDPHRSTPTFARPPAAITEQCRHRRGAM